MTITTPLISRFSVPSLTNIPEDIRACTLEMQEKSGFVPNIFLALSHRPDEYRALLAHRDALMLWEGSSLIKGEREMIAVVTPAVNQCLHCVVAYGAILRIHEKNPLVIDQAVVNYRKADITSRQHAMFDFTMKVCTTLHTVNDVGHKVPCAHGFDDGDIWDTAGITALLGLLNRMVNAISMRPNEELLLLGRLPCEKKV